MSLQPPRFCIKCREARVAWTVPRVDYCYACLPGGPFTPPRCRACGSASYFSEGLCDLCHGGAPEHPGACKDCLSWGVLRRHNWRCWGCRGWRARHPVAECPYCRCQLPIAAHGACRLCWHQAQLVSTATGAIDIAEANRFGQQLFLANINSRRHRRIDHAVGNPRWLRKPRGARTTPAPFTPLRYVQLTLFSVIPDLEKLETIPAAPLPVMSDYLDAVLQDYAEKHGWSARVTNTVRQSLQVVQNCQDTPGTSVRASEAQRLLNQRGLTLESTLHVLAAAGLLEDDREPAVRTYFESRVAGLPERMLAQLELWYTIMIDGSTRPPRRHPRQHATIHLQIRGMSSCLHRWAARGIDNLAEITRDDVVVALPAMRVSRLEAGAGLRSLFNVLKGRKEVFANPCKGMNFDRPATNLPLPMDVDTILGALNDPNPTRAFAVSLATFHGLKGRQIRTIKLTDISDGRLSIEGRVIPLAEPVRVRLSAYLDFRTERYPSTSNPHLLINRKTATRTTPVDARYPWSKHTVQSKQLREDRILHEVFTTGGDIRGICDLFGLSIQAACRYASVLDHPDLTGQSERET